MLTCPPCNFKCEYKSELNRHLNSKRHREKMSNANLCSGCFKEFSTKFNRNRHQNTCESIQNQNNIETQTNIETQINIETQNNINIILPENPESIKTFFMLLEDLRNKKTTDCFQRLLLDDMISSDYDLMDYVEKFDTNLAAYHNNLMREHNSCKMYELINKIDENGDEYRERILYTPMSHPDYKFDCRHEKCGFMIDENVVSDILAETLLDADDEIVVTHNNDIRGKKNILFKHKYTLHSDEILLEFINKSSKKELCNLSEDFKPATIIKAKYPNYYDKLEDKAIKIITAYNNKTKNRS